MMTPKLPHGARWESATTAGRTASQAAKAVTVRTSLPYLDGKLQSHFDLALLEANVNASRRGEGANTRRVG